MLLALLSMLILHSASFGNPIKSYLTLTPAYLQGHDGTGVQEGTALDEKDESPDQIFEPEQDNANVEETEMADLTGRVWERESSCAKESCFLNHHEGS